MNAFLAVNMAIAVIGCSAMIRLASSFQCYEGLHTTRMTESEKNVWKDIPTYNTSSKVWCQSRQCYSFGTAAFGRILNMVGCGENKKNCERWRRSAQLWLSPELADACTFCDKCIHSLCNKPITNANRDNARCSAAIQRFATKEANLTIDQVACFLQFIRNPSAPPKRKSSQGSKILCYNHSSIQSAQFAAGRLLLEQPQPVVCDGKCMRYSVHFNGSFYHQMRCIWRELPVCQFLRATTLGRKHTDSVECIECELPLCNSYALRVKSSFSNIDSAANLANYYVIIRNMIILTFLNPM